MFDLDYDSFTGKKKKTNAEKIRAALTPAMKENIKRVVGYKCEKCGRKGKLQIDHIKEVSKGGTNVGSNLIVLCPSCHAEKLTQAEMKRILAKRSKKVKQDITNILRNRNKVGTEKSTSSKPQSPSDILDLPDHIKSPLFDLPLGNAPKKKGRKRRD